MMKILRFLMCAAALMGSAYAGVYDLHFRENKASGELSVGASNMAVKWLDAKGKSSVNQGNDDVRIRVMDPPASKSKFGFDLERPFLIVDGIYLDPESERTLSAFQEEAEQFGLPALLKELGYTPVFVQFSETVERALESNAAVFSKLLSFMNDNELFGFRSKVEDGFIVMGISQGGVLGRYGSYLYQKARSASDAPVRLYASLDSPHQGAVMPRGLVTTVNFWASVGGSAAAEKFRDMIEYPGADELLLYQRVEKEGKSKKDTVVVDLSPSRFLFGEYRKAAEYDGFPAVLVAQGQMKGVTPEHSDKYYKLNRYADYAGILGGRVVSYLFAPDDPKDKFDHNRVYKKNDSDMDSSLSHRGDASLDFVQGSTYPFARTLFGSLREGFLEAMPRKIDHRVDLAFGWKLNTDFTSHWEDDTLYQSNSTFIPTVSAMDLKCGGNLAIGEPCAFSESYKGFPFESPKERSSADAAYAVDVTHPRFNEAMSGRHIELPGKYGNLDTLVLRGMQVDIWRLLCEVAKNNYDSATQSYRNPNLDGVFVPGGSCMDLSKMPDLIKKSGLTQWSRFGFSRYDYDQAATESDDVVRFNVPAGWHKVGLFNMGKEIPEGSTFEVDVRANGAPGSWVKMELLLTITNTGVGQVQLQEIEVPADGKVHTVRWTVPSAQGSLKNYRWFRLVANSSGVEMDVAAPRLIYARSFQMALEKLSEGILYPGNTFPVRNSSGEILINPYTDALGSGMELLFSAIGTNGFVDLNGEKDLSKFSNLKVTYWPGTCQGTRVYFDSYPSGAKRLENGSVSGNFLVKTIPLKDIINTDFTQEQGLSGAKLFLRASSVGERCVVNKIELE